MILFRPRAVDFQAAMRQIQLFDDYAEMDNYLIDYHNLHNIITKPEQVYTSLSSSDELRDTKSGWLHSRYICFGNIPLGIYDSQTLDFIKKPRLEIETDPQGGLKCQFELMNEGFIFFLGNDPWYGQSKMVGFKINAMGQPLFRKDNIPVTRQDFIHALNFYIAGHAIQKLEARKKRQAATQLMKEQRRHHEQETSLEPPD